MVWVGHWSHRCFSPGRLCAILLKRYYNIRPILKKANLVADDLSNYRHISNVPLLSKLMERVVADQWQAFLEEIDNLDLFQLGFRPWHSVETVLVALQDDLLREPDREAVNLLIPLQFSAISVTVDHRILLERPWSLGIWDSILKWFQFFLDGQPQIMWLEDALGPLLCQPPSQWFLTSLWSFWETLYGDLEFVVISRLYFTFSSSPGDAVHALSSLLSLIMDGMRANKLKLNPNHMDFLLVGESLDR